MTRLRAQLVLHGAIVLFAGLAAGWPYNLALRRAWGAEQARAWALAHSAGVLCGIMALAVAGVLEHVRVGDRPRAAMVWLFVTGIYAFTIGMWAAPLLAVRGILPWLSTADALLNVIYTVAGATTLGGGALLVMGAAAAWHGGGRTAR